MAYLRYAVLFFAGTLAMALNACAQAPEPTQSLAGWYSEHGTSRTFQPCGSDQAWTIAEAGQLPARAKAFDLQPDAPVYVKLKATVSPSRGGNSTREVHVREVTQFGSPTPVRNCAMTGVVTRSQPASSASR